MTKTRKMSPHAWLFFAGVGLVNLLGGLGILWSGREESGPRWLFSATSLAWTGIVIGIALLCLGVYLRVTRSSFEHDYEFTDERRRAAIVAVVCFTIVIAFFAVNWAL